MKKLLSFLAVAAIVTSAFAFSTKGVARFCVRSGSACIIVTDVHIETGTNTDLIYPLAAGQWDGQQSTCNNATPANCSQNIRLVAD